MPAPGTHENRQCDIFYVALLRPAIFVGTRIAGIQMFPGRRPRFPGATVYDGRIPACAGMSG